MDAPKFSQGEGVQRVRLSFPAFSDLSYDPTSAFSTSDAALDEQLQSALGDAPKSGAVAARAAAHAAALLGCLASAALLA